MIAWLVRGCLRKRTYPNEAEAQAACQRVMHDNRGTNRKGRLRAYRCHMDGQHWHVGHIGKRRR